MARKRLGAVDLNGTIGTGETIYTCPSGKAAVVSTIAICNRAATAATYRVAVSTTTSYEDSGYIVYGGAVAANDTIFLTLGVTLDETNKYLLASADATTVSVSAFGDES